MNVHEKFQDAVARSKSLPPQSNENLLKIYALYKQANIGDVSGPKPGAFNLKAKAKYQAWEGLKGMTQPQAMAQYVALIDELSGKGGSV